MRTFGLRWATLGILTLAAVTLILYDSPPTYALDPTYMGPEPATTYLVQGAWYDTEVTLTQSISGSFSDNRVKVSDASLLQTGWTIEVASDHGSVPERMTINGIVGQCDEAVDDDGDGKVNDGCPTYDDGVAHPETGAQCANALDDDGDAKVNDGCPTYDNGVPQPETGSQCADNQDNDSDGWINDGCPAVDVEGPLPETGAQCQNEYDDDNDGYINDGCPVVGTAESGQQCNNNFDDDGDGLINDGCPAKATPEWGIDCGNDVDDDRDGYVNDGCPEYHVVAESGAQCNNAADDDGDGKVNDGCPEYHTVAESGTTQCNNALDDDGDGYVNDGCPAVGTAESFTRDTMIVQRGVNGFGDSHSAGAPIRDHLVKAEIWVRNVPSSHYYGVGGFDLIITFDPTQLQLVKLLKDAGPSSWLRSTGRTPWCSEPALGSGTAEVSCFTTGNPMDPPWPKGPTGSGRIATVWFKALRENDLISRRFRLTGSKILDVSSATISSSLQMGAIRTVNCPDTNLDGIVNALDDAVVYINLNDAGMNSGQTLAGAIDNSQTTIPISGQGSLAVNTIIAVDNEHMRITGFNAGPPLTMTVQRDIYPGLVHPNAKPHNAGSKIFVAYSDGNIDGKNGYTDPRDTNDDTMVNALDSMPVWGVLNARCSQ